MRLHAAAVLLACSVLSACSDTGDGEAVVDTTLPGEAADQPEMPGEASFLAGAGLELSQNLTLIDADRCTFDNDTERAFEKLLSYDWETNLAKSDDKIAIGKQHLETSRSEKSEPDYAGSRIITASARFANGTIWNSLRLSRIIKEQGIFPESDGYDTRALSFLNSPTQVQNALDAVGIDAPISPGYRELVDDACGGSMQIEKIDGGAALSCSFGC